MAIDTKLVVYGGMEENCGDVDFDRITAMISYDVKDDEWSRVSQVNDGPSIRWYHSHASVASRYLSVADPGLEQGGVHGRELARAKNFLLTTPTLVHFWYI